MLPNGNLDFTSGNQGSAPNSFGQSIEVLPNGTTTYVQTINGRSEYRSYFYSNLYGSPTTPLDTQIVDDGDPAWTTTGSWTLGIYPGYEGDVHYSPAGQGSSTATWTFSVVPGQTYSVAATWTAQANRATDAPYIIASGGTTLGTTVVNQQQAPSGFTAAGGTWQGLGTFVATGSTLTVTLSNDANAYVIADAIRLQRVVNQQVSDDGGATWTATGSWAIGSSPGYDGNVHDAAAGDGSSAATWNFAVVPGQTYDISATWTAQAGAATDAPYTIASGGTTLGNATVNQQLAPSGFTAAGGTWQGLGTFVATGPILTVTLSNQANGPVIADAVLLQRVADVQVGDDIDPAWSSTGPWTVSSSGGFAGSTHDTGAGDGSTTATWTFAVIPGQTYNVATTWIAQANNATNAPYAIASGGTTLGNATVNQQRTPADFSAAGVAWQGLGSFVATGPTLTVTLSNLANGYVIADAILLQRVPAQQIVDDSDPAWTTTGSWTLGYSPGYEGDVHFSAAGNGSSTATWSFAVVPGQTYNVAATWTAQSNRATNAPYTVASGGATLGTVAVNQQRAPSGFTAAGGTWQGLGTFVATGPILTVTLSNQANNYVIADAILLQLVTGQSAASADLRGPGASSSGGGIVSAAAASDGSSRALTPLTVVATSIKRSPWPAQPVAEPTAPAIVDPAPTVAIPGISRNTRTATTRREPVILRGGVIRRAPIASARRPRDGSIV